MYQYYSIMRNSKDKKILRHQMVIKSDEIGITATAKLFNCSVNTVRKWRNRYKELGFAGFEEQSRRPHTGKRLSEEDKQRILKAKAQYKNLSAKRIKELARLPYSIKSIYKVLGSVGLVKHRRKRRKTRNILREVKARWAAFEQIQVDVKYLDDIPEYWLQMRINGLPKYQYTAREVSTGLHFVSYAYECSLTNSISFVEQLAEHLKECGVDLSKTTIQTDNGSEFIGSWNAKKDSAFTTKVEKLFKQHKTILPKAHTWQADVETVHNLVEIEFYELEGFKSVDNLLNKMRTYLVWFNFLRKNSYKENKTPLQLLIAKDEKGLINNKIVDFKPRILDYYNSNIIDHDVGATSLKIFFLPLLVLPV